MPEVLVAGAGGAGAAFALFLRERGMDAAAIALVDARSAGAARADDRLIAISHGSATLLARLDAWRDVEPHATPIHTIHVSHRGRFGRTVIDRRDEGVPALGYVVRHGDLTAALDGALARAGLDVVRPARVEHVAEDEDGLRVALSTGDSLAARLVVHAEGGLFAKQERRAIHRPYAQVAITSFVTTVDRHDDALAHTAFERFTDDGPIALLPAREDGRPGYALVWCGRPDDAEARLALDDADFLAALHAAFGDRLGRFAAAAARRSFPLGLNAVDLVAEVRGAGAEFAIGNAAQTLHPVAGQGLNLGLRDAYALARTIGDDRDTDAATLVDRYGGARRVDHRAVLELTDFMPRVFASPLAPVAMARGFTLALLDAVPPLRKVFARQMMDGRR